jgi:RHS repeat-associated protein
MTVSTDCANTVRFPQSRSTGKERDAESGNDYFGARYYASNMGRFISPDLTPFNIAPGDPQSWNLYSYAKNQPTIAKDSGGMWYTPIHKLMIEVALGGFLSAGEISALNHQQDVRDSDQKDQIPHFMTTPGRDAAKDRDASMSYIVSNLNAATDNTSGGGFNENGLVYFGNALHTLQDMTSPMHTSDDGMPKVWDGYGFLFGKGYQHWSGENDPSCSWSRFGWAIRLTLAAYLQANPGGAEGRGLTSHTIDAVGDKIISDYVDIYADHESSTMDREAMRQCALGNPSACGEVSQGNITPTKF